MALDARDIGEAQTTSYLIMDYVITRPRDRSILVEYSVTNIGTTPSHHTEMAIKIRPHNVSYPKSVNPFSKVQKINLEAIAGGASSQSFTIFTDIEDPEFFSAWPARSSVTISATVEVTWVDVFGKWHHGWFLMENLDSEFKDSEKFGASEFNQKMLVSRSQFRKLGDQKEER